MNKAEVKFEHYELDFNDEVLSRFGSRYFSRKEAEEEIYDRTLQYIRGPIYNSRLTFSPSEMSCANEVFPEAALADPVADLEVWISGARV